MNQLTRLALEMGPLVVFFIANFQLGIFPAIGIYMAVTPVALIINYVMEKRFPIMPLVAGAFILVFGGLALIFEDDTFFKIKPTLVNMAFAGALFTGLAMHKNLLKIVFQSAFELAEEGWRLLTWRWAYFFVFLAVINEVVWRTQTTDFWVSFKVFGLMPITIVFSLFQVPLIIKYQIKEEDEASKAAASE